MFRDWILNSRILDFKDLGIRGFKGFRIDIHFLDNAKKIDIYLNVQLKASSSLNKVHGKRVPLYDTQCLGTNCIFHIIYSKNLYYFLELIQIV